LPIIIEHQGAISRMSQFPKSLAIKAGAGVVALGVIFIFAPYFEVAQTDRTVVTNWGKASYVADPGIHLRVPVMQGLVPFAITTQSIDIPSLNTYTIDSQELTAHLTLQYRLPADKVMEVYSNMGTAYASKLVSMVIDRFKTAVGRVNAIDLSSQRGKLTADVLKTVQADAARLYDGVEISDIQLVNFDWNDAYRQAISNASVAKAAVDQQEQQEQQKRRAQVQAEQAVVEAEGAANAKVAQAQGYAKSATITADADAHVTIVAGEAAAQALKAQNEALANNQSIVALTWAQRWDGHMPTTTYGGNPVPMVMGK